MNPSSTVRSDEIERFNRLAATWWDRTGPMRPLHVVNELRLVHVLEQIAQRFARPVGALGHAATFSFFFSHHISTIEGGIVVTDDGALATNTLI